MFWVEGWAPDLGLWVSLTAHERAQAAKQDAENRQRTYRRDYRVTDSERREIARYITPGYWSRKGARP